MHRLARKPTAGKRGIPDRKRKAPRWGQARRGHIDARPDRIRTRPWSACPKSSSNPGEHYKAFVKGGLEDDSHGDDRWLAPPRSRKRGASTMAPLQRTKNTNATVSEVGQKGESTPTRPTQRLDSPWEDQAPHPSRTSAAHIRWHMPPSAPSPWKSARRFRLKQQMGAASIEAAPIVRYYAVISNFCSLFPLNRCKSPSRAPASDWCVLMMPRYEIPLFRVVASW